MAFSIAAHLSNHPPASARLRHAAPQDSSYRSGADSRASAGTLSYHTNRPTWTILTAKCRHLERHAENLVEIRHVLRPLVCHVAPPAMFSVFPWAAGVMRALYRAVTTSSRCTISRRCSAVNGHTGGGSCKAGTAMPAMRSTTVGSGLGVLTAHWRSCSRRKYPGRFGDVHPYWRCFRGRITIGAD